MTSRDMAKYAAMRPYFEVVAEALKGLVDGTDFFDMHAEDVVVEYIITVPDYPRTSSGAKRWPSCTPITGIRSFRAAVATCTAITTPRSPSWFSSTPCTARW